MVLKQKNAWTNTHGAETKYNGLKQKHMVLKQIQMAQK